MSVRPVLQAPVRHAVRHSERVRRTTSDIYVGHVCLTYVGHLSGVCVGVAEVMGSGGTLWGYGLGSLHGHLRWLSSHQGGSLSPHSGVSVLHAVRTPE